MTAGLKCGSKTRAGGACGQPAGWGTDHVGQGKCKLHGGKTPIKHGRYSTVQRPRIQELMERLAEDPDPFDLEPEARLIRALATDFCERYEELVDALLAWNAAEIAEAEEQERKPRPQHVPAIHEVASVVEMVSRVVERAQKVKDKSALSLEGLQRIMAAMGATVAKHVEDPDALRAIEREWGQIRVSG